MIVDKIKAYLSNNNKTINKKILEEAKEQFTSSFSRQFMEEKDNRHSSISPSSVKPCVRQMAYKYHNFNPEPFTPRTSITFFFGDISEIIMLYLAKLSGCDIGLNNEKVSIKINDLETYGYIDGLLRTEDNIYYHVEFKSMSDYAFKKFVNSGMSNDWGYLYQNNLYLKSKEMQEFKVQGTLFVGFNKNTGEMNEEIITYSEEREKEIKDRVSLVTSSTKKELPERYYSPTQDKKGNVCLDINCSYCSYKWWCWDIVDIVYASYNKKPLFVIIDKEKYGNGDYNKLK